MDLCASFKLSRAEERVARYLLCGYGVAQIAQILGHQVPTIRTQVAAILKKSKSDRVVSFICLVASLDGWEARKLYPVVPTRVKPHFEKQHHADLPLFKQAMNSRGK